MFQRNTKMKKATKTKVWSCAMGLLKAALTGIFTYLCAQFGGGCTTINFPTDDARPTTFTGVTNFRVK